ncbi:16S rRNA (cytosine(1402)-N(4))-methyltransferase RsmH [Paraneptunicella aestuarii]|uniref:16S rRNA (cytosine(1402)-N(4))-methyltransferase RsmH n=1 Tax=Paraneptunicella aestuarii TaxID=2831148 RepID=UPI001E5C2F41|nr:16S rRNA (cytosine(1402)-N(4))-methyltransferase RsmH [Paraneptunicella aestuarii]UAA38096.1 16S rRNA (cytosine(1402)-N(4))-methyltransferase RsmH [Paraneptunicella aestuarii]
MNTGTFTHTSVLLQESIDALHINADGVYVDATFGRGGHSRHILQALSDRGRLIALDRDPQAIEAAKALASDPRFTIFHVPFSHLGHVIEEQGLQGKVDGVLMDLGVSSPQLDDAERGFSFSRDGKLDMRMDTSRGESAADWLAHAEADEITRVIKEYGEEKFGKRIAHAIVTTRDENPIVSTLQLAKLIDEAVPVKDKHKHPATRSFQAIRIHVNNELGEIETGLKAAAEALKSGGRLAVISFHSLEDRIVKRFMREQSQGMKVPHGMPILESEIAASRVLKTIGKAIKPSAKEIEDNIRARSSVLRVAEKL